ncbi:DsbA family oxidoreductase [Paroceanicella profunda]|uniref:DsbA family oxidoreductase n=1 Tax=Paroceanicella profunda TaxID=2579971 RepID=A0A5B8FIC5_9RHOB|nr:DsbA family oxidoreductase [Paroceanicella profunda]QDL92938.1 DsbA family oxidoreductase [Paroceanicella profunda]
MITLDIISDPICPWCYLGKAKLDRALDAAPDHPFDIRWRPFRLNPDMPPEGADRRAFMAAKFGAEQFEAMNRRLREAGAEVGIAFEFERITRTPDTTNCHRLIRWASVTGNQTLVVDQLFRRYFREGQDISELPVLVEIAEQAGMDGEVILRLLTGDTERAEIEKENATAREMGVTGVPTFLIGGKYVLQGAQESETWAQVIEQMRAMPMSSDEDETEDVP